jgi:tRNA threonylcarbamoyladenosine biosynthesis protein TsaE
VTRPLQTPAKGAESAGAVFSGSVLTRSAVETQVLAAELAGLARPGDLFLLDGGLGMGKTTFAKGFAAALGVEGPVTSPTFSLLRQYTCGAGAIETLLHADVYRLESFNEVDDLGMVEQLEDGAVALVEWGEPVAPVFGASSLTVRFERVVDEDHDDWRAITLIAHGSSWAERVRPLRAALLGLGGAA